MKKLITVFLALALVFSCMTAIACNESQDEPKKATYTVTFMVGSSVYKTQEVEEGKYVVKPVAPTAPSESEEFAYWCSDAALTQEFSFTKTKPTSDLTLYAKFEVIETPVTVRFFNGETEIDNVEITSSLPTVLGNAEADKGYVFIGWALDAEATEADYEAGAMFTKEDAEGITTESDISFYAVFKEATLKIAVWERYYLEYEDALENTEGEFMGYIIANELDYLVEYRIYGDDDYHGVADFGKAINDDGDIDVIIGSGANINSSNGGGVTVITKANLLSKFDPNGQGRQAALVTDTKAAIDFYKFVTGLSDNTATVTLSDGVNNDAFVLSELLGDSISYVVPEKEGSTFVGYAYTENAAKADISTTDTITYAIVKDKLEEGAVTLYPVFEEVSYDLTVYVYLGNKNYDITEDEFNGLKAAFNTANPTANINWVSVFGVNNTGFCSAATNGKADVIMGGKAMTNTCAETYPKVLIETSWVENETRYIGVISGSEDNELAVALYNFVLTEPAE